MSENSSKKRKRWLKNKRARLAAGEVAVPKTPKAAKPAPPPPLFCPYCGSPAVYTPHSRQVYRKDYGPIWICRSWPACDAFVGCHPDGLPLGRLARPELRRLKIKVHDALDALWRARMERSQIKQGHARARAYVWLAKQMGIEASACHVGMFDEAQCERAIEVLWPWYQKPLQRQGRAQSTTAA